VTIVGVFVRFSCAASPEAIKSLHRDTFGLPSFWLKRTKVDVKVSDGSIATAEISR
jgi:hypothetical protein